MEIILFLRLFFVRHWVLFFNTSHQVTYLFHVVTLFDDTRITLTFATFKLPTEIAL